MILHIDDFCSFFKNGMLYLRKNSNSLWYIGHSSSKYISILFRAFISQIQIKSDYFPSWFSMAHCNLKSIFFITDIMFWNNPIAIILTSGKNWTVDRQSGHNFPSNKSFALKCMKMHLVHLYFPFAFKSIVPVD